jgi:hypothetical protein
LPDKELALFLENKARHELFPGELQLRAEEVKNAPRARRCQWEYQSSDDEKPKCGSRFRRNPLLEQMAADENKDYDDPCLPGAPPKQSKSSVQG